MACNGSLGISGQPRRGTPTRAGAGRGDLYCSGALVLWFPGASYPFRVLSKNAVQRFQPSAAATAL